MLKKEVELREDKVVASFFFLNYWLWIKILIIF